MLVVLIHGSDGTDSFLRGRREARGVFPNYRITRCYGHEYTSVDQSPGRRIQYL